MIAWALLFWAGIATLAWGYLGYPVVLLTMARRWRRPLAVELTGAVNKSVSVVIAARNEAERVAAKLTQLGALPLGQITEIIIVCDHCTDNTAEVAREIGGTGVKVVMHNYGPSGKAGALNAGVTAATGELILFSDVRQRVAENAIPLLAAYFDDQTTGAVSGSLQIERSVTGVGKGMDAYWSLEKKIRHWEALLDSSIGCTGAIYMIRRKFYTPIKPDTILDDVVVPMLIAQRGYRVRFAPEAEAFDPQALSGPSEFQRKTRTLAGNFQMLFRYPEWLAPWSCRLWWKVISHKYIRIATPLLLLNCLAACIVLRNVWPYWWLLIGALGLIALGLVGLTSLGQRSPLTTIPGSFLLMQISIVRGLIQWVRMTRNGYQGWK